MESQAPSLKLPDEMGIGLLVLELERARAIARESGKREDLEPVRRADAALVAAITEGAVPCPHCGNQPHGMVQNRGLRKGTVIATYMIGCRVCQDQMIEDVTRERAVVAWNGGMRLPKKE